MSVNTLLKKARKIIAAGWTKGTFARDADGQAVGNNWPAAQCFCAVGAIRKAANWHIAEKVDPCYADALVVLKTAVGVRNIPSWNDACVRTKEDILRGFDKAIEASK